MSDTSTSTAAVRGGGQAPVLTVRSAVTRGRLEDRATMTRRPLARVCSAGWGNTAGTGWAIGGGGARSASGARVNTGPS